MSAADPKVVLSSPLPCWAMSGALGALVDGGRGANVARILDANQPCARNPRDRNAAPESARDSELVPKIVFSTKQRFAAKKLRFAVLTSTPLHNLTRKIDNLTSETTKHPLQPTAARALTIYAECRAPRVMTRFWRQGPQAQPKTEKF
jgi:hypothetical protein